MQYKVPFVKPKEHYQRYKPEFDGAISDCLTNGDLIARHHLRDFEAEFARYVGTRYAVGLNSGYHALALSLLAAGIGPGDEVITVAHTFVATVSAIVHCGAKPVLIDVGPDHNMDVTQIENVITPKTKAILPVHLNGRSCDMDAILHIAKKRNLQVIEDACQSLGATFQDRRTGSFGLTGCWSFYPFKILGCFGDGGAVTTDSAEVARKVTLLRFNGEDRETGEYHDHGYTALLDNVQAAVLSVKMRHFPSWLEHRRKISNRYRESLAGVGDLKLPHFDDPRFKDSFQNYVIRTPARDALRKHLTAAGVETIVSWPKPMWEHSGLNIEKQNLPQTASLCREVLSLPMSAETTIAEVDSVSQEIKRFFSAI